MNASDPSQPSISIIGGGLAGSEAALQLAKRGFAVKLYDMKPVRKTPAHHSENLAEIVCSNSFGSQETGAASGLIKQEMALLGCELLEIARMASVPAGKALAVDRERFAALVTERIRQQPLIEWIPQDVTDIPVYEDAVLIATGPLTSSGLADSMAVLLEREQLYFFDAASPIIERDSVNMDIAFLQDRYGAEKGPEYQHSYINCPLDREQYNALVEKILTSEKVELKTFEKTSAKYFESCLPVEVIAGRGEHTLRFGPMKPVGLVNPHTGERPYAVVQLRQDNAEGTLYNMVGFQTNLKWGAQKEMIRMIPGLENAEVVRYGVMHRNTYIHSPEVLQPTLQLRQHPHIFFAGQLTGTEGYTESVATGMMAAINISRMLRGETPAIPPSETMLGALLRYITRPEAVDGDFQPINSNWGILPPLAEKPKDKTKKTRNEAYAKRALAAMQDWAASNAILPQPHLQHA